MMRCASYGSMKRRAGYALLFMLLCCGIAQAQERHPIATPYPSSSSSTPTMPAATVQIATPHSPQRALLLSALLPGVGQVYNRQAWKIPIIYTGLGACAYFIADNYGMMKQYRDEYVYRVQHNGEGRNPELSRYPTANIYNMYDARNRNFQLSILVTAAVYGLNLVDAFIFGHLFEFEMDDNLSLFCHPTLQYQEGAGLVPAAGITLRF